MEAPLTGAQLEQPVRDCEAVARAARLVRHRLRSGYRLSRMQIALHAALLQRAGATSAWRGSPVSSAAMNIPASNKRRLTFRRWHPSNLRECALRALAKASAQLPA